MYTLSFRHDSNERLQVETGQRMNISRFENCGAENDIRSEYNYARVCLIIHWSKANPDRDNTSHSRRRDTAPRQLQHLLTASRASIGHAEVAFLNILPGGTYLRKFIARSVSKSCKLLFRMTLDDTFHTCFLERFARQHKHTL